MYMTLKEAVMISVLIHSAVFIPVYGKDIPAAIRHKKESITVDYIKYKEPERITRDTGRTEIVPKVEMKRQENPPVVKAPVDSAKAASDALAAKQAKIVSTGDYINYYQLIREKIRRSLKDRYRNYYGEGDVCLVFSLGSDGSLITSAADPAASTQDGRLIDIALRSLKDASPFASFPKALTLPQMSFTLTVSFKRR
ncbi:MAG: hypothetical protein V1682_07540 [Candidatus Omnitrophota bacterium]